MVSATGTGCSGSRPRRRVKRRRRSTGTSNRNFSPIPAITASSLSLVIAIFLWYTLGILSISTTKILLEHLPPLVLTLQQLFLGSALLRLWNRWYSNDWEFWALAPTPTSKESRETVNPPYHHLPVQVWKTAPCLFIAATCFTFGFLATNFGFGASSASFVETIKAAEPLTSAGLAVGFGLEDLTENEWVSLGCIILGVSFSTLANTRSTTTAVTTTLSQSILSCAVVMFSNLSFSLRGLYQKWFQSKRKLSAAALQCVMQQIGVCLLVGPAVIFHGSWLIASVHFTTLRGVILALINGLAFTSYNLASTYLLTRITVVRHAALNCIRRIFAIVATSLIFHIPITILGTLGIVISVGGFMAFSYAHANKQSRITQRQSELSCTGSSSMENDSDRDYDLESYGDDKDRSV